jgi:hypothetical protein
MTTSILIFWLQCRVESLADNQRFGGTRCSCRHSTGRIPHVSAFHWTDSPPNNLRCGNSLKSLHELPVIAVGFQKSGTCQQISINTSKSNLMKTCLLVLELLHLNRYGTANHPFSLLLFRNKLKINSNESKVRI